VAGAATPWNPGLSEYGVPYTLVVSGNTLYAGGDFTSIGGQPRLYLAAVDASTGVPTAWNPGPNSSVLALVVSGGTVFAGGYFDNIGGQSRSCLAALDAMSGAATAWNPAPSHLGYVYSLTMSSGTLYATGTFTSIGGRQQKYVAALDTATGLASDWSPDVNYYVYSLAVSGPIVYVGGPFTSVGVHPISGVAAFSGDVPTVSARWFACRPIRRPMGHTCSTRSLVEGGSGSKCWMYPAVWWRHWSIGPGSRGAIPQTGMARDAAAG
jgi:hypothetical protein